METKKFSVVLPTDLIKRADDYAKTQYLSRADIIRVALREYLERKAG